MPLAHPEVRKVINEAQTSVRILTGNDSIVLVPQCHDGRLLEFGHLCQLVCSVTGVDYKDAIKKDRSTKQRRTRQLIAYFAYRYCGMTYKNIGEMLGGRHHTTMMSSCDIIRDMLLTNDPVVCGYVNEINSRINSVPSAGGAFDNAPAIQQQLTPLSPPGAGI